MKIEIPITQEENDEVKALFQMHNVSLDILKSLLNEDINEKYLDIYFSKSEQYGKQLDDIKEKISSKYIPEELKDSYFNYTFNFKNCSILYESTD